MTGRIFFSLVAGSLLLLGATAKRLDGPPDQLIVVRPLQRTVTLDVKDAEVRDILKSMQRQCGIKNLIVDPNVQGKGTFFFHELPCGTAFPVVLRTLGLQASGSTPALTNVGTRPR